MERKEIKILWNPTDSGLNGDDADYSIGKNQIVNGENVRWGSTDNGVINVVESIGSNTLLSAPQPSVSFITIGSVSDPVTNRIIYCQADKYSVNHKIVCYENETFYDVLLSSQVEGGLNFNRDSVIHSIQIIDNFLYWVEGQNNQPRKINIEAGLKLNNPSYDTDVPAYSPQVLFSEITIIKPPPPLAPNITKLKDVTFENNFIANESYMFAFQYIWYDNETTVLGTYSQSSRLNKSGDTENYISVTMDDREYIPGSVRIVRLICRFSNSNNAFVIRTWDKENTADSSAIDAQNNGMQPLEYDFYGNIFGEVIPNAPVNLVLKPFDSVPIYSEALSAARNRIFLGDNTEGYDTPLETSLSLASTTIDISGAGLSKNLIGVRMSWLFPAKGYSAWYVYLTEVYPVGYYEITSTIQTNNSTVPPSLGAAPVTVAISGMTWRGSSQAEVLEYVRGLLGNPVGNVVNTFNTTANVCSITGVSVSTYDVFKSQSQYQFGVVFYDFAMRKCGVVTNEGLIFEIPSRDYDYTSGVDSIVWSLSNSNALNEIPDWAYYYCPVRTLNLRTRFFIQSFTNAAKYATKDADGNYQFTSNTFITNSLGIGLNTTALVQSGLGYVYNEGDVCVLIRDDDNVYILPVIGQDGNYIIVKAENLGDLSNREFVFEIYTPYLATDQEPFYEVGQMYRILNPGTDSRTYETLSDIFIPDSYVLTRNYAAFTYFGEAMSPNDLYYKRWDNDGGKTNFVTKLGQVRKRNSISFSNTIIPNTGINGLSTFDALDEKTLPIEVGGIKKLQITSKVQGELGIVMLAICERQTASLYIGEVQQYGSAGESANLVTSEQVIGTVNVLKGNFGTLNPESVTEYRGNVFWLDRANGRFIQYGGNGLYPISNYKMTRFWKLFCDQFNSMTAAEIEALGDRPFVFTTVDPYHDELLVSIPKLLSTPPKGYLPDYPSTVYPFDVWDGLGKTMVYDLKGDPNSWRPTQSFVTENFVTLQNKLYSFKYGQLYEHNQTNSFNSFYGVQGKSKVMFVSNQESNQLKVYNNISIESNSGNLVPSLTYFYVDNPYQQASDLMDFDWTNLEGVLYATLYRNKLVPTAIGYNTNGLLTAEKIRTNALKVLIQWDVTTVPLQLRFVTLGYIESKGHNQVKF